MQSDRVGALPSSVSSSPQVMARTAGWLYLGVIVLGIFAELFVRGRLVAHADAEATAHNILANEFLFRSGFVSDGLSIVCDVALSVLLYFLLRPVSDTLALLAMIFELVGDVILGVISLAHFGALMLVSDAHYLTVFSPAQLHAAALFALKLHGVGYDVVLVPIAFRDMLVGYLIYRSGYFPKIIGVFLAIAGVLYLADGILDPLAPKYSLPDAYLALTAIGEFSFTLWLIVMGVNVPKWNRAVAEARTRASAL